MGYPSNQLGPAGAYPNQGKIFQPAVPLHYLVRHSTDDSIDLFALD
jgi:hypothetical protein